MSLYLTYAAVIIACAIFGWLIPALAMRALRPTLEALPQNRLNYRGRPVFLGLGLVWAIWAISLQVGSTLSDAIAEYAREPLALHGLQPFDGPLTLGLFIVPMMLVMISVLFGLVDDTLGDSGDKGFRGHMRALAKGRITTGGLKLLGIGLVSAVYGWAIASAGISRESITSLWVRLAWWVAATLVIALSANLMNLLDLRPGRALKSYSLLAVISGGLFTMMAVGDFGKYASQSGITWTSTDTIVTAVGAAIVLLGPVLAVWRLDLGERGMLGDAGSNAMGAIVGYMFAGSLSLPWLSALAVVLLALNLVSERVSFSAVIEKTPGLRALDRLGRLKDSEAAEKDDAEIG